MQVIRDSDVQRLLSMVDAIDVVEKAFAEFARGTVLMPPRSTMMLDEFKGSISLMPSYLREMGSVATKIISIYPKNPDRSLPTTIAWIAVNDPETGMLEALIEANYLTSVRTGAVTGVAARYLAPMDSRSIAVIGCGVQGRTQAWAVAETFDLERINIFDISRCRMKQFKTEIGRKLGIDIKASNSGEEAVKDVDIVVTATTSREPVINRSWLGEKVHVSAIGSFYPDHRELDTETISEAKVVVDSREAVLAEAGDLLIPIEEKAITREHIYAELGEIVSGKKKGRVDDDGLTVFKSVGLAIQDSSVASLVLKNWRE